MVKIRLQGTSNDLKRMIRVLTRNKDLEVVNISEKFVSKGTLKYYHQYMDVRFLNNNIAKM